VTVEELKQAVDEERLTLLPVERVLRGDGEYTLEEVADRTGLETETLRRHLSALGLGPPSDEEKRYDDDDVDAAGLIREFMDAGLPEEGLLEVARVLGQGMQRTAEAVRSTVGEAFLQPGDTERDLGLRYAEALRQLGPLAAPTLQHMLNLRLREQMREAVIGQAELQSGQLAGSQPVTVGFVDIVGFTKLGEDVAPEDLGTVVRGFERAVSAAVEPPVRLVKTIGDAAMLVAPEPGPLVDAVLGLVERSHEDDGSPMLRGGVASGEALPRAGDWYGRPVNLASRITSFARRGSVLTSKEVRESVGDGYSWSAAGSRRFKGVKGNVEVFRVRRPDAG
jgi:adenylate cyclase